MKTKVKEASVEKSTSGKMNGAMMLVEALKEENVEVIFGYPEALCFRFMTSCMTRESNTF